ncbi:MAG: hypothetical protein ACRDP3_23840 [Streptomyces sp.]|uniref:hypothetical protein n=1 Tax=Streptomyces sp. TaxID=1931 RepID=UPI003D6C3A5A
MSAFPRLGSDRSPTITVLGGGVRVKEVGRRRRRVGGAFAAGANSLPSGQI